MHQRVRYCMHCCGTCCDICRDTCCDKTSAVKHDAWMSENPVSPISPAAANPPRSLVLRHHVSSCIPRGDNVHSTAPLHNTVTWLMLGCMDWQHHCCTSTVPISAGQHATPHSTPPHAMWWCPVVRGSTSFLCSMVVRRTAVRMKAVSTQLHWQVTRPSPSSILEQEGKGSQEDANGRM